MNIRDIQVAKEAPIFIVGAKRGGTTLMRRVVDAHGEVTIPPPGWFYHFVYPYLYSYGDLTDDRNVLTLIHDCLEIPAVKKHWNMHESAEEILNLLPERSFRGVITTFFRLYAERYGSPIWGAKTPANVFWINEIFRHFPKARFILLFRDGRDVSVEQVKTEWGPTNLYTACLAWQHYVKAMLHAKKELPAGSYLEVRYEDFVTEPDSGISGICDFLEIEYDPTMVRYYKQETEDFLKQGYHRQAGGPITDEYVGIYKNLPLAERQLQVAVIGDTLRELGYAVEDAPREIGYWERERYLEADRHGGQILEGGVEYKHLRKKERAQRKTQGIWSDDDALTLGAK